MIHSQHHVMFFSRALSLYEEHEAVKKKQAKSIEEKKRVKRKLGSPKISRSAKPAPNSSIISRLCLFKKSSHKLPIQAKQDSRVTMKQNKKKPKKKNHRIYGSLVKCWKKNVFFFRVFDCIRQRVIGAIGMPNTTHLLAAKICKCSISQTLFFLFCYFGLW